MPARELRRLAHDGVGHDDERRAVRERVEELPLGDAEDVLRLERDVVARREAAYARRAQLVLIRPAERSAALRPPRVRVSSSWLQIVSGFAHAHRVAFSFGTHHATQSVRSSANSGLISEREPP